MHQRRSEGDFPVNCRVGSSETLRQDALAYYCVNCRVGSSEMLVRALNLLSHVNCRVGSSERPCAS